MLQRLSNGSIDPDSEVNRVIELQETLEKQNNELTAARTKIAELTSRIKELEDAMSSSSKEQAKSQEQCIKLQRDLREVRGHAKVRGLRLSISRIVFEIYSLIIVMLLGS